MAARLGRIQNNVVGEFGMHEEAVDIKTARSATGGTAFAPSDDGGTR